ncbi:MAG: Mut7-C RNAse domain-containing protein [Thermoplasmata archaeon]
MEPPRWAVDEMLGRLARYLRFLGYDAEYLRGRSDAEILVLLRADPRVLLTRDRRLAGQVPGSVLLTRRDLEGQLRELRGFYPSLRTEPRFDRCAVCNIPLAPEPSDPGDGPRPPHRWCPTCGRHYWEGSHTARIRASFAHLLPGGGDPA